MNVLIYLFNIYVSNFGVTILSASRKICKILLPVIRDDD